MTTKVPKVRAWSNTVRKEDFNAADLDLFVLRDHQPILAALGRERADETTPVDEERPPAPEPRWLRPYRYLSVLAPAFTIAAFGGRAPGSGIESDGMGSEWAVPYLALLWLLAAAGPWFVARRWWAADRHWEPIEVVYGLVTVLLAAAVLRGLTQEWGQGWLGLATLPVWVTGLGAALFLLAVLVASRGRRSTADVHFVRVGEPDPTKARQMIEALPARMREQLHDMRRRAVDTLRKRGLVDDDEASRLLSTPLGEGPLPRH